jgi:recombination protein RecT
VTDVRTAVATQQNAAAQRQATQAAYIERLGPELRKVLPKYIPEERMVRLAASAIRTNEKLQRATPLSLAGALMTASVMGLEPNTPTGDCFLVPYENRKAGRGPDGEFPVEAQLIIGYQGLVRLYNNSPASGEIFGEAVYPEDEFTWARGTSPFIDHRPHPEARAADSQPKYYYAVAILRNGARPFVVLTAEEVKTLRRGKVGPSGDIPDPQRWLEKKVPMKQLCKTLPKSTALALAVQADESSGTELYVQQVRARRMDAPDETGPEAPALAGPVEDPPPGGEGL